MGLLKLDLLQSDLLKSHLLRSDLPKSDMLKSNSLNVMHKTESCSGIINRNLHRNKSMSKIDSESVALDSQQKVQEEFSIRADIVQNELKIIDEARHEVKRVRHN